MAKDPSVSAIERANTPFMDRLMGEAPTSQLLASGESVGLPDGQMGNSEVGHMNLGAGRIVYQDLVKVSHSIADGDILDNAQFQKVIELARGGKRLHLLGLVSDGGVHSHIDHLKGLLTHCHAAGLEDVHVHAFTDGRDTDPNSGLGFMQDLESHMASTTGRVASITGRYYAMDRDKRWERVAKAYHALVNGDALAVEGSATGAIQGAYNRGETDEFIEPMVLPLDGSPVCVAEGDIVLFFNFRTDRGRQLTQALSQQHFHEWNMARLDLEYFTMTNYDQSFQGIDVLYEKDNLTETMGQIISEAGLRQIRIAETEKYPHVTFFFNGGQEEAFEGEERILIPSPKVATYDLQPEMSAFEVRDAIVARLEAEAADFVCLNFANPDMVGHTGVMEAAVKAVETVDACTQKVVETGLAHGYSFFILADHGNCDCMINEDGSPNTAHTTQPVPFHLVTDEDVTGITLGNGVLGNVAPTILDWMGVKAPAAMTNESLIQRN